MYSADGILGSNTIGQNKNLPNQSPSVTFIHNPVANPTILSMSQYIPHISKHPVSNTEPLS